MYDQGHVMKMLSDPEIVKDVHLYVSKEKAGDDVLPPSKQFDIAPSDHPNESDIAPSNHQQRPLRRSKRLNVIQVTDQCDDDDGDYNNCEKFVPGHEAEALDNEQGQDHNQVEHDVWEEITKMKEHIKRQDQIIEHMKNKEGHVNNEAEEENLQSNANGISRLPILHGQRKRIQYNKPVEARLSMQDDISEDNNLSRLHEKAGDHDVTKLQIQQNSSLPWDLVIDSVPEVRKMRDLNCESFSRQNQHGTRTEHPRAQEKGILLPSR
ncbi:hypothetical protein ZWY2020_052314 [Hordeum vulgare]|nr:hypothetical protein ZWY2020_052314 [Hordeum vulgare]